MCIKTEAGAKTKAHSTWKAQNKNDHLKPYKDINVWKWNPYIHKTMREIGQTKQKKEEPKPNNLVQQLIEPLTVSLVMIMLAAISSHIFFYINRKAKDGE